MLVFQESEVAVMWTFPKHGVLFISQMQVWCMRCFIGMTYFCIARESCIHRTQRRLQHFSNLNVHKNRGDCLITKQSPRQTQSEGLGQGLRFCLGASSPRTLQLRISGPGSGWNRPAYEIQSSPGVNLGKCERGSHVLWGRGVGEDTRCHVLSGLVALSATPAWSSLTKGTNKPLYIFTY